MAINAAKPNLQLTATVNTVFVGAQHLPFDLDPTALGAGALLAGVLLNVLISKRDARLTLLAIAALINTWHYFLSNNRFAAIALLTIFAFSVLLVAADALGRRRNDRSRRTPVKLFRFVFQIDPR